MTVTTFDAPLTDTVRQRETPTSPYEVAIFETRTGIVRRWAPLAGFPQWERGTNLQGSWSVPVAVSKGRVADAYGRRVQGMSRENLTAFSDTWYWSWAVCQGDHIWQAGPVLGYSPPNGFAVTVYGVGIWKLLTDKRVLLNPDRASRGGAAAFDADVCFGTSATSSIGSVVPLVNRNLALPSIAARIVETVLDEPGGDLPIDIADTTIAGTAVREYGGYELSSPGAALANLAQDEGGPEQEFSPYFTDPSRHMVRWSHDVGNPRLGQVAPVSPPVWDLGLALVSVGHEVDGGLQAHRFFQRGAGTDRATLIGFAEDLGPVTTGPNPNAPLLESVDTTHSQTELIATLTGYARAQLATDMRPILTLSPTVRLMGDAKGRPTRSPRLSQVSGGDVIVLRLRDHDTLPDGRYTVRVLRLSGANDGEHGTMDVQTLGVEFDD